MNYKALTTMVIRGSSKKEIINLNEIEYIFLLHDNEIYYFSETENSLRLVDKTFSTDLHMLNTGIFFYIDQSL